jgi:hypothetical protein
MKVKSKYEIQSSDNPIKVDPLTLTAETNIAKGIYQKVPIPRFTSIKYKNKGENTYIKKKKNCNITFKVKLGTT